MTDTSTLPPNVVGAKSPTTTTTVPPPAPAPQQSTPQPGPISTAGSAVNAETTKIQVAAKAAPQLDPQTTVAAAASAQSPAEAAQNAQVTQIFNTATKIGDQLKQQPPRAQLAMWNSASKPLKDILVAAGFTPPEAPPPSPAAVPQHSTGLFSGLWHDVAHEADNVRHGAAAALDVAKSAAVGAGAEVGKVASVGVAPILHGVRTAFDLEAVDRMAYGNQAGTDRNLGSYLHMLVSPDAWVKAWHATANGAATFNPSVVRALSNTLSPFDLSLAKYLASGMPLQQVLQRVPEAQRAQAYASIETNTDLQDAISKLSDAHLDFGQAVFGQGNPFGLSDPSVTPFGLQVHPLSGVADGIVDWYASPLVLGSALREASNASRFAILDGAGNARDVRSLYQSDNAIRSAMDRIGTVLTSTGDTPNIAGVINDFKMLNPLADDLQQAFPEIKAAAEQGHAGQAVAEFMSSEQAMLSLARGRAGLFFKKDTLFPHLTIPGRATLAVKTTLDEALHGASGLNLGAMSPRQWFRTVFGKDAEESAVQAQTLGDLSPRARFARRATTLTPLKDYIDLTDPDRASVFERYAKMFLPDERANQLTNAFMAIPVTDQGRQLNAIYGLQEELMYAAGLDESAAGRQFMEDWQRRRELEGQGEHYSFGNNAFYRSPASDEDIGREHAILPSQLSSAVMMPEFRELYQLSKKSWAISVLGGHLAPPGLDRFMERVWKPLLLLRPGFGIRVAGEELLGHILRNGLSGTVASRLAASAEHITSPASRDLGIAHRVWSALTSHIPPLARRQITNPTDMQSQIYGWRAMNFLRKAGVHFVPDQIMDAAKWWAENGRYEGPLAESIDALTQHTGGIVDDEHGWVDAIRRWGGGEPIRMRPIGKMTSYGGNEDEAFPALHYALSGFAHDEIGQVIAKAFDEGQQAQLDAARAWMDDPKNAKLVSRFVVAHQTPDGRLVDAGEASADEARAAWARALVDHVNHYVTDQDGRAITFTHFVDGTPGRDYAFDTDTDLNRLVDWIAEGNVPDVSELETISRGQLPNEIVARKLVPSVETGWQKFINASMREMVGRPLNWMSRQPIFLHNFSKAFAESKALVKSLGLQDEGDMLAGDIASERAWRETLPYIHNPRVRSQMSIITRNLAPFWFAQEQFFKRWARTFATYPEAFRKAQLLMNGLRTVGFVQKDQYGQDSFVYPGSGFVNEYLARAFPGVSLLVPNAFSSEISQLNPSFGSNGLSVLPGVGPAVSIPMRGLDALIPALDPFLVKMLGPSSPAPDHQQSLPVQLLSAFVEDTAPTILQRIVQIGESTNPNDPFYSSMKASAAIQAAQYLEAAGHGPPKTQDVAQVDAWKQRLASWTQTMMALRVAFGFASPASPTFKIGNTELGNELSALTSTLPYDQAVAAFLRVHPDASAYTIGASTTGRVGDSGAYIPATQGAIDFIDQHLAFFKQYSAAAPWLFPLSTGKGVFSDQAYQSELALNLRQRQDFGTWWQDVRYAEAANIYFPLEAKVKAAEAADPGAKSQLQHDWDAWVTTFKEQSPIFASMLDEPTASNRRNEVVQQMQQALASDALPKTPQAEHIALLMAGFQKVQDFYQSTQGESSYNQQHAINKKAFLAWGDQVAAAYPDVAPFWTGVLSKVVPG